jgi:hypothetical protein
LVAKECARCRWKRCYKLVSLIRTNSAAEFFLYAEGMVTAGQDHEAPDLYRVVEGFVEHHGRGVVNSAAPARFAPLFAAQAIGYSGEGKQKKIFTILFFT